MKFAVRKRRAPSIIIVSLVDILTKSVPAGR